MKKKYRRELTHRPVDRCPACSDYLLTSVDLSVACANRRCKHSHGLPPSCERCYRMFVGPICEECSTEHERAASTEFPVPLVSRAHGKNAMRIVATNPFTAAESPRAKAREVREFRRSYECVWVDEPKENVVMARDESEQTRVARLVMMLLGDGGISFKAHRDIQQDTWVFGARCKRCGEETQKEVTPEALVDCLDVGEVGMGLDCVQEVPRLKPVGTFLGMPMYLEHDYRDRPSLASSMRFASVAELLRQWLESRPQPVIATPVIVPQLPTPSPARDLKSLVYQALGEASMCWSNVVGAGTFDSDRALMIGERLLAQLEGVPVAGAPIALPVERSEAPWKHNTSIAGCVTELEHVPEHKHEREPRVLVDLQDEP